MADSARLVTGTHRRHVRPMVLGHVGGWLGLMADSTRAAMPVTLLQVEAEWRGMADSTRYARGAPPHTPPPLCHHSGLRQFKCIRCDDGTLLLFFRGGGLRAAPWIRTYGTQTKKGSAIREATEELGPVRWEWR